MSRQAQKSKVIVRKSSGSGASGSTITAVVANYASLPAANTVTGKFYWVSTSTGTYLTGLYYSNGVSWEFNPADEITVVANYSALPAANTVSGQFYWCSASQGTSWLPGSLGGTYYSAGLYYSNGVSWEFLDVPYQATQAEVNTGTNTDKFVTPATLASATTVVPRTGAAGDVVAYSAANTLSNITAVASGSYMRSAGAATKPIWSTLILPNSATTNRVAYATSTNTWGESSDLTFDGSVLMIGGSAAISPTINLVESVKNRNNGVTNFVENSNAGTAAFASQRVSNGTSRMQFMILGTGYTTSGGFVQGAGILETNSSAGLTVMASNASGAIRFYTNGTSNLRWSIDSSGHLNAGEAINIILGTSTGTKIGTATTQKIGVWNATPIVQPTTAVAASTFTANTSGIANDTATFDGYTIGQVVKALRNIGLLA